MQPASPAAPPPSPSVTARFAVVDVETSGLSAAKHRVLQVAVVTVDGDGTVLDTWVSLIRPRWRWLFRLGPQHIHGLDRARLRRAPSAQKALCELNRRIAGSIVVGHNAEFDVQFLRRAAQRTGVPLQLGPHLCTLWLSRRLDPQRELSHRLGDVSARYGITIARPHDALEDALATAAVLPHLLRAHGITTADQLSAITSE